MSEVLPWGPRRAAVTLGVTQTIGYAASLYLPAILARPMAEDLGMATSSVFAAFSAALLLTASLGQALGRTVDRYGGRTLLVASNLVFAAGLALLAASGSSWALAAGWLVMGLGMALGLYDVAFAGLVGWFGAQARGPITGVTLIAGFASTVGWPLTAWLEASCGWRATCLAWAAAHLLLALPLHLSLRRLPPAVPHASIPAASGSAGTRSARTQMTLMAAAFAAMSSVASAVSADLPPLLIALGAAPAAALAAAVLVGPSQVAARLAEFFVLNRAHPLTSARLALALFPLGAMALLAVGSGFTPLFVILYGCGNGLFTIARGSLPLAVFGPQGYGARLGLISMPGRFLQAGAPFGFAVVMEHSPPLAMAVLVGLGLFGLACLLLLRPAVAQSQAV